MSIVVVGSVAYDGIKSPSGSVDRCLGGAATYFALAASYFTQVRVVAVVGEDFSQKDENVLRSRNVDTRGIEHTAGRSFFWRGEYGENLNEAKTLETQLNVFQNFNPQVPPEYLDSDYLFLANIDPVLQGNVRRQMDGRVKLVGGDTMNYWITDPNHRKNLLHTLKGVDLLLINDNEAKLLAGDPSVPRAAQKVLQLGPRALVIKHGEYGATVFFKQGEFGSGRHPFRAPALPMDEVRDPTGAGDSFAGGFMGYIASQDRLDREVFKRAMFYGGVMGSFAVERFGTERLQSLTREEIDARYQDFCELTHLGSL
jgi:sugar/nucleoside kinase (ribokinase family)